MCVSTADDTCQYDCDVTFHRSVCFSCEAHTQMYFLLTLCCTCLIDLKGVKMSVLLCRHLTPTQTQNTASGIQFGLIEYWFVLREAISESKSVKRTQGTFTLPVCLTLVVQMSLLIAWIFTVCTCKSVFCRLVIHVHCLRRADNHWKLNA